MKKKHVAICGFLSVIMPDYSFFVVLIKVDMSMCLCKHFELKRFTVWQASMLVAQVRPYNCILMMHVFINY